MLFKDKIHNVLFSLMIIATFLGIYAQSITYYIAENIINIPLSILIVVITLTSLLLFIVPAVKINKQRKLQNNMDKITRTYLILNLLLGGPISAFSIFVMLMWLG